MISKSSHLYINSKKYTVLKQVDNKFLLELEGIEYKLVVGNINNNRAFGVLYTGKNKENVIVQTKKEFKYIGDIMKEKKMKKFSELVVGDMLYIYFNKNYIEKKISKLEKIEELLIVENDFQTYFIQETEKDFIIIEHVLDNGKITEAISTSMDRLLLELEEC